LLAEHKEQYYTGGQEQIQEECLAIQTLVNFDNVDGFVENGFTVSAALLLGYKQNKFKATEDFKGDTNFSSLSNSVVRTVDN
jgi:hypothetical protein